MSRVIDPVPLYKDGLEKLIPAIDAGAWILAGWSASDESKENLLIEEPPFEKNDEIESETTENPPSDTKVEASKRKSSPS